MESFKSSTCVGEEMIDLPAILSQEMQKQEFRRDLLIAKPRNHKQDKLERNFL